MRRVASLILAGAIVMTTTAVEAFPVDGGKKEEPAKKEPKADPVEVKVTFRRYDAPQKIWVGRPTEIEVIKRHRKDGSLWLDMSINSIVGGAPGPGSTFTEPDGTVWVVAESSTLSPVGKYLSRVVPAPKPAAKK